MDTINNNLTPEQKAGIKQSDVTNNGEIDVTVLENKPAPLPEQTVSDNAGKTLSVAENLVEQNQLEQSRTETARIEAAKLAKDKADQETIVETLGLAKLGEGAAETKAIKDAGINETQTEINAFNKEILGASKALAQARVQDQQDVKQIAFSSRGVPLSIVQGKQAMLQASRNAERNLDAIDLENSIATSELLQGNTDNARKAIQRANELKYADKRASFKLQSDFLARIDTKESQARSEKIKREERQLDKAEEESKQLFDIAAQALEAGAGTKEITAIRNSNNVNEALSNARSIGSLALLDMQLKRLNISSKSLDIKEQTKKLNELTDPDSSIDIKPDFDAATFAKRMSDANAIIGQTERGIGEKIGTIASLGFANREERQKRKQAEANFVNALLRKESGAAISPEEFDSARKQYFPRSTDTEATREQKAQNRNVVFEGMRISSGDAYDYLVNEIETGSPQSLLDSINIEETTEDFFNNL